MRFCSQLFMLTAFAGVASARADTFTLTGPGVTDVFVLPSSPAVSASSSAYGFSLNARPGLKNGTPVVDQLTFFTAEEGGGLLIEDSEGQTVNGFGPQLYKGSVSHPTFRLGSFELKGLSSEYSLTVSSASAVTPEPGCLILLAPELAIAAVISGYKSLRRKRTDRPVA